MERLEFDSRFLLSEDQISDLARESKVYCGVYFLLHEGRIVYVGQSINIYGRLARHIHDGDKIFDQFALIEAPLAQLNEVETAYILHFQPKYNFSKSKFLRTPFKMKEHNLNRGPSDRVSPRRQLDAYNEKWDAKPEEWASMIAKKLTESPS